MLTSLYTAISGLSANGVSLSVIGDNIANLNTTGFKSSRASFDDVLSQTISGTAGSSQVGRGVLVSNISPLFTQGSFETTQNALDLAIDGNGFFIVGNNGTNYYTRAGQFSMDKNGNIVNPDGLILQGYLADASGNITSNTGDLKVVNTQSPAHATSKASISLNLDATSGIQTTPFTLDGNGDGTGNDPANYNYSSTTTVYDSQGGPHDVTQYYEKTADNAWTVHYVHNDPANPNLLVEDGTQSLTFDQNGALVNDNDTTPINFNFGTGVASPQAVTFDYGTGTAETPPGDGLDGTVQFASAFAVSNQTQDGYAAGSLNNMTISQDGVITGAFTNGQTRAIGQVALAKFSAPDRLTKQGENLYAASFDSGEPIIATANTSGVGRVLSDTLELSNVDLAAEFVNMISAQRGFEANSKVITTTDQLMQDLLNMKQ